MTKRRDLLAGVFGLGLSGVTACASIDSQRNLNRVRDFERRRPGTGHSLAKGYLDGPFGQIHYYEAGSGPCLIMAHQSPTCARMFERAMPFLSQKGIRVIAIDTPGYGNSDVPSSPPAIPDYADAFSAVLDGLGLNAAHLLGHHTGAGILCNFAARNPTRVKSLILSGPPVFSAEKLKSFRNVALGPLPIRADGSHLQERWDRRTKYSPGWTDAVAMHRRLVDQMWAGDTWWYGHNAAFKYDMAPDLRSLTGRVLILTNTGDDIYHLAKRAISMRPDFLYEELLGGTHDIVDEQPEAWSDIVAEFVLNPA